jgi:hypothetical protein
MYVPPAGSSDVSATRQEVTSLSCGNIPKMIRVTPTGLNVSVSGPVVYLDNWAIYDLAENDPLRRRRFVDAVHGGIDLLFSVTNAAELSGPQGRSADAVKRFLDEIGPHWFPARLDATEVVRRETRGESPEQACLDEEFFKSYVVDRIGPYGLDPRKLMELPDSLFTLGPILDRVGPQRDSISKGSAEFDEVIKGRMSMVREKSKREPTFLDERFPLLSFAPSRRTSFVYRNLLRITVVEADSLKKGDGLDFCHAVIACAFGSFAALDTQWKRRVGALPPNALARVYSPRELDQMVTDMEFWLEHQAA